MYIDSCLVYAKMIELPTLKSKKTPSGVGQEAPVVASQSAEPNRVAHQAVNVRRLRIMASYRLLSAEHVLVHAPTSVRLPSPSILHRELQGLEVVDGGLLQVGNLELSVMVSPVGATPLRITRTTQVSYSSGEYSRYYVPYSSGSGSGSGSSLALLRTCNLWRHDSSVEAAVLGSSLSGSLLLCACKGSGVRTLLRSVLSSRPMLELFPGRLIGSSSFSQPRSLCALLCHFFSESALPLFVDAVVYIGDLEVFLDDSVWQECGSLLSELVSRVVSGGGSRLVVVRVSSPEALAQARLKLHRKIWHRVLEVPFPCFQTRAKLVVSRLADAGCGQSSENDDRVVSLANALAGVGLAEACARIDKLLANYRRVSLDSSLPPPQLQLLPSSSSSGPCPPNGLLTQLLEVLLLPRRFPGVLRAETGVLLHGPPGTGKTLLVRRLARLAGTQHSHRLLTLRLVDVVRGEVGAGERAIATVFQEAKRVAPAILFIDEFQALFVSRSVSSSTSAGADDKSLSSTLAGCFDDLAEWNAHAGSASLVTVIAATNEPWAIDEGFLRPGRFDRVLFVGPLSEVDRAVFLQQAGVDTVDKVLLDKTEGFSGADMELLAIRAQKLQIRAAEAFFQACTDASPTSTPVEIREYESWQERHL